MWSLTPEATDSWFNVSNNILIIAAFFTLIGAVGTTNFGRLKDRFSNESIKASEAIAAKANERVAINETETARANERTEQLRVENLKLQAEVERTKENTTKANARIAVNETETARAKEEAIKANLEVSKANERTEQLRAENLVLEKAMMARNVGLIGIDEEPRAKKYFDGIQNFAGTEVEIQVVPDAEAQNLANEISIVLMKFGWRVKFIDERRSNVPLKGNFEGITVFYPVGESPVSKESNKSWLKWKEAADQLAAALTKAGLGIYNGSVSSGGLVGEKRIPFFPYFDPPLTGVYLQVGARPISLTLQSIQQNRKSSSK